MKPIIARYFYCPICPDSFSTIDKLKDLFSSYNQILFESFNVFDSNFKSPLPFFESEKEVIDSINEKGNKPLLFGRFYIEGKEVPGFPPLLNRIRKILYEYGIIIKEEEEKFNSFEEVWTNIKEVECDPSRIVYKPLDCSSLKDCCMLCTKFHPYLSQDDYIEDKSRKYEGMKESFLKERLNDNNLIGYVAYYKNEPLGFIEGYPLKVAKKLGFPATLSENGYMITCLSIRKEYSNLGIASKLVDLFEEGVKAKNSSLIEVLAFPDEHKWQPFSLYQKKGYETKEQLGILTILRKQII